MLAPAVDRPVAQFAQTGGENVPIVGSIGESLLEYGRYLLPKFISEMAWIQPDQQSVKHNE
jgi:hypothetical protein